MYVFQKIHSINIMENKQSRAYKSIFVMDLKAQIYYEIYLTGEIKRNIVIKNTPFITLEIQKIPIAIIKIFFSSFFQVQQRL